MRLRVVEGERGARSGRRAAASALNSYEEEGLQACYYRLQCYRVVLVGLQRAEWVLLLVLTVEGGATRYGAAMWRWQGRCVLRSTEPQACVCRLGR